MLRPRGGRRKPTSGTLFLSVVCFVSLVHTAFFLWTRVATYRRLPQPIVPAPGKHANDSLRHINSTNQKRLLIAVPVTDFDLPVIQDNLLRRWKDVGPACSGDGGGGGDGKTNHRYNDNQRTSDRDDDRPVLWFYYAKGKKEQHILGALFDKVFQTIRHTTTLSQCFARVQIVHANIPTKIQDDYPAGVNLMFYNLLLGRVAVANDSESGSSSTDNNPTTTSLTTTFHSVFWMEPDVFPIKPYWIDRLVRELALDDQFWVKGSIYMGDMFDGALESSKDWQWIGHINGNALYRLNSPDFAQFLRIVMDLEPPDAVWKPFDVSIWKVLHDFPYFWHVYQRVAKHFVYADFIDHWAFTLTDSDIQHSKSNPQTYLVHGKNTSAGITRYRDKVEKIRGGLEGDQRRADAAWQKHVSVFIRAQARDVDYVVLAATSVSRHLPWAREIVIAVPRADVQMFTARLEGFSAKTVASRFATSTTILKIVQEEPMSATNALSSPDRNPSMQDTYTRAIADTYCSASSTFILQLQADCLLMRPVSRKDLFWGGKPIVRYDHYANVPTAAALWQAGTKAALGSELRSDVYVASSCSTPELFPREVYTRTRKWIEQTHARSFRSFLATQRTLKTCLEGVDQNAFCRRPRSFDRYKRGFSLPAVLGAFEWSHMHEYVAWFPHNQSERRRTTFVPILSEFGCQGNLWLAQTIGKTGDDLEGLKGAMASEDCMEVRSLRRPWAQNIIRRIG